MCSHTNKRLSIFVCLHDFFPYTSTQPSTLSSTASPTRASLGRGGLPAPSVYSHALLQTMTTAHARVTPTSITLISINLTLVTRTARGRHWQ